MIDNFWLVSATFLNIRKKWKKHAASKCGVIISEEFITIERECPNFPKALSFFILLSL